MGKTAEETKGTIDNLIIEGTVISAYIGKSRFSDTEKSRLAIKSDSIPYDKITAFNESGAKLTPAWFKDKNGYMNLASIYDIPVKDVRGRQITFEEFVETETAIGSKIKISIVQRDGAIYPKAFRVLEEGEPRDPFEGL
jgi:hypothetical protein